MTQFTEGTSTWGHRTARRGAGLQRFVAAWAAFGVTLSGATQLRVQGLPLGPSEAFLAAWMAFVAFLLLRGVRFASTSVFTIFVGYWLAQLTILALGAMVATDAQRFNLANAMHDGAAFVYVAVLSTLLTLRLRDEGDYAYHWHVARMTFFFHAIAGGTLLGLAFVIPKLGPIDLWYGGIRFRGWSENPNQMALAMAAMPFLGWWLMRRSSGLVGKAPYLGGIALCIAAGLATRSDGMRVAWVASAGAIFSLLLYGVIMRGRSRWLYISHLILPALVVVVGVSFGADIVAYFDEVAEGVYVEGHQGEKRFTLWFHGLQAIKDSPLVGFGPGPFSGYNGPFEAREAHNSFIDWGMSTGALGVAIYASLLIWIGWSALRSREMMPVAMLISVVMVSVFGYVLRQPDLWAVLILVLLLSKYATAKRGSLERQPVLEHQAPQWAAPFRRAVERSGGFR